MIPLLPLLVALQAAPAPPAFTPSAYAVRARDARADLVLLQALVPLRLTESQIERLLPPIRAAQTEYVQLQRKDDEGLKALEAELTKARDAAIAGTLPDAALEKKVLAEDKASLTRLAESKKKVTLEVLTVLVEVLTADQKDEIERQSEKVFGGKRVPREFANNPSKAPKDQVQALALAAYIERVLLIDRTLPLLEKMKANPTPP
jgi:hypothetical protein